MKEYEYQGGGTYLKKETAKFQKLHYLQKNREPRLHSTLTPPVSMNRSFNYLSHFTAVIMLIASIAMAESANSSFNQGFEKHKKGDLKNAIQRYSTALEENPSFSMAYQMRGIALQQLNQYSDAISDYSKVIATGDNSFKVVGYYNRGIVKNMIGDFAGAIPDFSQAIELDKKMAAAFFHRGIAKGKTGDLNGRMDDFRQAALLGEVNAEKWLNTYFPDWKQPQKPPVAPLPPTEKTT